MRRRLVGALAAVAMTAGTAVVGPASATVQRWSAWYHSTPSYNIAAGFQQGSTVSVRRYDSYGAESVTVSRYTSGSSSSMTFTTATGTRLAPGTYDIRPRQADVEILPGQVGLSPLECSPEATGQLTVHDAVRDETGAFTEIALSYAYECLGAVGSPRYAGEVRLNSTMGLRAATVTSPPLQGSTAVGEERQGTVTYTNVGSEPLLVSGAVVDPSMPDAQDWRVEGDGCAGVTVTPGGTCTVTVTLAPTTWRTTGDFTYTSARLVVDDDSAPNPHRAILYANVQSVGTPTDVHVAALPDRYVVSWRPGPGTPGRHRIWSRTDGTYDAVVAEVPAGVTSWADSHWLRTSGPRRAYSVEAIAEGRSSGIRTQSVWAPRGTRELLLTATPLGADGAELRAADVDRGGHVTDDRGRVTSAPSFQVVEKAVYYGKDEGSGPRLWRRYLPSGPAACLTCSSSHDVLGPAASPRQDEVAYTTPDGGLHVLDVLASVTTLTGVARATQPTWTRDGLGLVVADTAPDAPLRLVRLERSWGEITVRQVGTLTGTSGARGPAASPRGDWVAFIVGTGDGSSLRLASTGATAAARTLLTVPGLRHVTWTQDAAHLVVTLADGSGSRVEKVDPVTGARALLHASGDVLSASQLRVVDTQAPSVQFTGAAVHRRGTSTVPFRVEDDTHAVGSLRVECFVDGVSRTTCGPDGWTGTVPPGTHSLTVRAEDWAGRSTEATTTWSARSEPRLSDLDGDGDGDLLSRDTTGRLYLYPGNGRGGFTPRRAYGTGWNAITTMTMTGDVTGNGTVDLLARDVRAEMFVYPGDGNGGLGRRALVEQGWEPSLLAPGDFDGDGQDDVLRRRENGDLHLCPGDGASGLSGCLAVGRGWNSFSAIVTPGDFDGDGKNDLLARDSTGRLHLYPGNGVGGFRARVSYGTGWNAMTALVSPGDFNGDGASDLLARDSTGRLHLYPGNGKGGFRSRTSYGTGWNAMTAIVG